MKLDKYIDYDQLEHVNDQLEHVNDQLEHVNDQLEQVRFVT